MSLKRDIADGFPPSIDFPDELAAFVDWSEANNFSLWGVELQAGSRDDIEAWFGHIFANSRLGIFATGPDGSLYAIWKDAELEQRVVFLGSEGEVRNLTSNVLDFLRLLAIGYGEVGYADLSEPPEDDFVDMIDDEEDEEFERNTNEALPEFRVWLQKTYGVQIPQTGDGLVDPEDKSFAEWVERMQLLHGK